MLDLQDCDPNLILFKADRMYQHNILRVNYTTYDVRRSQDVVNGLSSHCNIIVLDDNSEGSDANADHPYRYARVLGTYHVNIIYIGPGMVGHQSHRMEFLWVRWYCNTGVVQNGRKDTLDRISFGLMGDEGTFGFLDPSLVLRGCHLIPAFAKGQLYIDGKGMSLCARDSSDWREYYVNR
jgi:hypothetical protein